MKFLQIGLGSMGKRRIRNLYYLGFREIIGFDVRRDRVQEACDMYGIDAVNSIEDLDWTQITHVLISTPPDCHSAYAFDALSRDKHVFIEASVVDDGYQALMKLSSERPSKVLAPSCTMRFDPLNIEAKKWIDSGEIGELLLAQHHFGLYLPKWHPYESIKDFYVSKFETGGAREIVPFDLVYLVWLLGKPVAINAMKLSTKTLDVDIDDIYALTFKSDGCRLVQMSVDVVSKVPYRTTKIIGKNGNLELDTVCGKLSIYQADNDCWVHTSRSSLAETKSTEEMYIHETKCFIDASLGISNYPYSLADDLEILNFLYSAEKSAHSFDTQR